MEGKCIKNSIKDINDITCDLKINGVYWDGNSVQCENCQAGANNMEPNIGCDVYPYNGGNNKIKSARKCMTGFKLVVV